MGRGFNRGERRGKGGGSGGGGLGPVRQASPRFLGVEDDARFQRLEIGEFLFGADVVDELGLERLAVEVLGEVEQMDLQPLDGPAHGGPPPEVGDAVETLRPSGRRTRTA